MPKIFPNQNLENLVISVTGIAASKDFSALITNLIPDFHMHDTSQCFPLYTYEKQSDLGSLFATNNTEKYTKKSNIPDTIVILNKNETLFSTIITNNFINRCVDRRIHSSSL